jgi:hypothetical protein
MVSSHVLSRGTTEALDMRPECLKQWAEKTRSNSTTPRSESLYSSSMSSASSTGSLPTAQSYLARSNGQIIEQCKLSTSGKRLWHEIHYTSQWGALPDSLGMARLALTDEDKTVRDYFVSEASSIGCNVHIDEMGNIFAVLPGEDNSLPPLGLGSHLDTQPAG